MGLCTFPAAPFMCDPDHIMAHAIQLPFRICGGANLLAPLEVRVLVGYTKKPDRDPSAYIWARFLKSGCFSNHAWSKMSLFVFFNGAFLSVIHDSPLN